MRAPGGGWENLCRLAGSPERIQLVAFRNEALKPLTGKTLAEVAAARGRSPEDTVLDLVVEDESRIGVVFFLMSEENVRRQIRLPWVSFGSDAGSMAPEGVFLKSSTHPRAYGNFARLLGRYVRDEKLVPLEEAVRRLTSLPAENLGLDRRGRLVPGHFADVVVFDPADGRGPGDVREPAPVRGGRAARPRERGPGAARRRAHGGAARAGPAGARAGRRETDGGATP